MQGAADRLTAQIRDAARRGERLMPRGAGRWWPDVAAGTEPLDCAVPGGLTRLDAADLVATAGAGCTLADLAAGLAAHGAWLALDPPGPRTRTLGGALGSGASGPLAAGFGPPRDQVLGLTIVAGNGQVVRTGGRVVKNVAGFDLAKLVIGGHGAFGIIVEAHLRLRARPAADRTRAWALADAPAHALARELLAAGVTGAAFEIVSPALAEELGLARSWTLLLRALGTEDGVSEELDAAAAAIGTHGTATTPSADVWERWSEAAGAWPASVRIGADPASWGEAAALLDALPGNRGVSVTVPRGTVRAGFDAVEPAALRRLRESCAARRWPVTLERADAATRAAAGIWGALDPRVHALAVSLRGVFDPNGVFAVPLWA
ncbi:MAG: FAD-binding oxidoreductase [Gemmatimonadales bacterium]